MSELKPFKAHFEYYLNGNISEFINQEVWDRNFQMGSEMPTKKFAYNNFSSFKIPFTLSNTKVELDYNSIHSEIPESLNRQNINSIIEFKINSKSILVLQITDNKISFSNHNNEVLTVETDERLKLIKD